MGCLFPYAKPRSLQQILWKISRAREGSEALDMLAEAFIQSNFYTIAAMEQDRQGRPFLPLARTSEAEPCQFEFDYPANLLPGLRPAVVEKLKILDVNLQS